MIPLTRGAVRPFLAVARRASPNGGRAGFDPLVRIAAGPDGVTLAAHCGSVILGRRVQAAPAADEEFVVPLTDLRALDGRGDGPVELGRTAPGVVTARWTDEAGPHEVRLPSILGSPLVWPAEPKKLWPVKPDFPAALHEAGKTAAREVPNRYATDHIQVRGKPGQVTATDGKQALVVDGFTFPFADDLLVPAVPVFGCKDLGRERAVSIGVGNDRLFLILGPWRVWLRINRPGRFPDVAAAIPKAVAARVTFSDADADRLIDALSRLPGGTDDASPVTLDVDHGRVEVRARGDRDPDAAIVPLPGSAGDGPPMAVVLNRRHFGRALAVGCRELTVSAPGKPFVFRGPDRTYLTVALDPADAVPPKDADRVARALARPSPVPDPEPDRRISVPTRDRPPPDRNGHADGPPDRNGHADPEVADTLAETEALKAALAEVAGRAARLVAALKSYRRERQTLRTAWSSLRALNLGP